MSDNSPAISQPPHWLERGQASRQASLIVDPPDGRAGSYGRNGNGNPTTTALQPVERFTLIDANTLRYEVTVTDPGTWTRPWTVRFPLARDSGYAMYEYACHERNYALANMLRAASVRHR